MDVRWTREIMGAGHGCYCIRVPTYVCCSLSIDLFLEWWMDRAMRRPRMYRLEVEHGKAASKTSTLHGLLKAGI